MKKNSRHGIATAFVALALFLSACTTQSSAELYQPLQAPDDIPMANESAVTGQQPVLPLPGQPNTEPVVSPTPVYDSADVVWIQQRLQDLGYYAGDIDGAVGQATQGAIEAYQTDQGMAKDGRPTAELREFMWRNGG